MNIGWASRLVCLAAIAAICGYSASFSKCGDNQSGSTGVGDVQAVIKEVLEAARANDDLNTDGIVHRPPRIPRASCAVTVVTIPPMPRTSVVTR